MDNNGMMNVALTADNAAWLLNVMVNQVRQLGAIVDAQNVELSELRKLKQTPAEQEPAK